MFNRNKYPEHQGGYRQGESSREQNDASHNVSGARMRPRFNPSAAGSVSDQRRPRQRFSRTGDTTETRFERPQSFGTHPRSERPQGFGSHQRSERPQGQFRPRTQNPSGNYSQKKQTEYKQRYEDPTKPIRLNKFLANAGICSRREADDFIQAGVISVNGEVVDNLGAKVLPTDKVMFHDQPVRREKKVYILLNKPKDTVTTTEDPEERHTVLDIVRNACPERIYPVGRLDRNLFAYFFHGKATVSKSDG